jgi:predicted ArsR family transcriptional regulator
VRQDKEDTPGAGALRGEQRLAAVCGLDDPVRRSLYDYVSGCGEPVGRDQAATAVRISRSLAAYHLDRLVDLGLLTADYRRAGSRRGPGAGRPAKVYSRSQTEIAVTLPPREYELAARLLAEAVETDPTGSALAGLRHAARRLGAEMGTGSQPATPGAGSASRAMRDVLAAHGFEPYEDDGLRLRNCPFHQLAARHPGVVCAMNLALLDGVTDGIGAGRGLRAELDPGPDRCCVVVRAGEEPTPENPGAS